MKRKRIRLACGRYAIVDARDYERLRRHNWFLAGRYYAARWAPRQKGKPRAMVYMHQQIAGFSFVDHRDGHGLHNWRTNLRPGDQSKNSQNSRRRRTSTSRYKGAVFHRQTGKWQAYVHLRGKRICLGLHWTPEAAAHVYDKAARRYFGEYAALNFPKRGERSALK